VLKGKSRGFIPDAPNQPKGLRALCLGGVLEGEAKFGATAGGGALISKP